MKNLVLLLSVIILNISSSSAQWQKTMGGSAYEFVYAITETSDGGFITTGYTESANGDLSWNYGNGDCWIIKYDNTGSIQWHRQYGGSGMDYGYSIEETSDGGFIVAGFTESSDGDVTGHHGNGDSWVLKLAPNGGIQWQKTIGGTQFDSGQSIQQTADGGYVLAGYTGSLDGDISGNHGDGDCFISKLDAAGTIEWTKCYGGSAYDCVQSVCTTNDGGYIFAGYAHSADGDLSLNYGNGDWWIVKIDATGNITWKNNFGGTDYECAQSILQSPDGGYIIGGYTESPDGDVTGYHGGGDAWVLKLNNSGAIEWQKCLGSSLSDYGYAISQKQDGSILLAGYSGTSDGDVLSTHGGYDAWVVQLSGAGAVMDQFSLGGSAEDLAYGIEATNDGGFIIAGYTESNDGDVSGNHGGGDCWIIKSPGEATPVTELAGNNSLSFFQNDGYLSIRNVPEFSQIRIYDITGKLILEDLSTTAAYTCYLGNESKGIYICQILEKNQKISSGKFVLQ